MVIGDGWVREAGLKRVRMQKSKESVESLYDAATKLRKGSRAKAD